MKRILCMLSLCLSSAVLADNRGFVWDYPAASLPQIDGFRLYCGTASGSYATAPTATVTGTAQTASANFPAGSTNYCVVRAFKGLVESANSNEVSFTGRPDAPTNLRLSLTIGWDEQLGKYVVRNASVRIIGQQ